MTEKLVNNIILGCVTGAVWLGVSVGILAIIGVVHIDGRNQISMLWLWMISAFLNTVMQEMLVRGYLYQMLKSNYNIGMGNVYQVLRDEIPFPMIEVWRHSPEEITRFKQTDNAVLFAAGSCWEGVDFPGDMVSSLIIVKLPFAVPDPISEAQKKEYDCLKDYIQAVVVPDMQKKLRQGFGRALRTETDTCVVTILDERAGEDGRYHEEVMCALPKCKMAEDIKDVQRFIRNRKGVEYYL